MKKQKATYNAVGSRVRNGPRGRKNQNRYGFVADMRLKLKQKVASYILRETGVKPHTMNPADWRARRRAAKEFFSVARHFPVTHYGKQYWLDICGPYCVILSRTIGEVMAVFPVTSHQVLIDKWADKH